MTSQGSLAQLARRIVSQYVVAMPIDSARQLCGMVAVLADRVGVLERELAGSVRYKYVGKMQPMPYPLDREPDTDTDPTLAQAIDQGRAAEWWQRHAAALEIELTECKRELDDSANGVYELHVATKRIAELEAENERLRGAIKVAAASLQAPCLECARLKQLVHDRLEGKT